MQALATTSITSQPFCYCNQWPSKGTLYSAEVREASLATFSIGKATFSLCYNWVSSLESLKGIHENYENALTFGPRWRYMQQKATAKRSNYNNTIPKNIPHGRGDFPYEASSSVRHHIPEKWSEHNRVNVEEGKDDKLRKSEGRGKEKRKFIFVWEAVTTHSLLEAWHSHTLPTDTFSKEGEGVIQNWKG